MRNKLGALAEGVGALLGMGFIILVLALETGGISFRKDCATPRGTVSKSWTVQWFIPIPYLFRPSEAGCSVHTGTRVALNAIGVFPFSDDAGTIAQRSSTGAAARASGQAYYAVVYSVVADVANAKPSASRAEGERLYYKNLAKLEALHPPSFLTNEHQQLLAEFREFKTDGRAMAAAQRRGDQAALQRLISRNNANGQAFLSTADQIRKITVAHR